MKKLSFLLAVLAAASMCLASCGGENTDSTTPAGNGSQNTTPAVTTPTVTPPSFNGPGTSDPEPTAPELLDGTKFVLDGDLSEWEGLHTIEVVGVKVSDEVDYSHKKVTFYGAMSDLGLHLACDAYHDEYLANSEGDWWTNTNYEFFIGASNAQKYVFAKGLDQDCATSSDDVQAKMVTEQLTDGPTVYHSITEVFVPVDYLNEGDIMYNTMDVGVAWKTLNDLIIGGAGTYGPNGEDEYWVPKDTWPNGTKPIVAPTGIWLPDEFVLE